MSRAQQLAEQLTQWTCTCLPAYKDRNLYDPDCIHCAINPEATEAADLLRQQEAVIKQCVEALTYIVYNYVPFEYRDAPQVKAALAAAKECLK